MVVAGRYQLEALVGVGAMGSVYRATQLTVGRSVAVKILNGGASFDPRIRSRFEIEARAVSMLDSPNCITLFDFGYDADSDVHFTVFDYVDGPPLSRYLGIRFPVPVAMSIVLQVASALDHAHQRHILHRDLKPANIMLARTDRGDRVRVLDFGLARMVDDEFDDDPDARITRPGELNGTPAYMSPEQCDGGEIGPATDIYALGCIAFELLEGRLPFEGDVRSVMQAHQLRPAPEVQSRDLPPDFADLVRRSLRKLPEERPTAAEIVKTLAPHVRMDIDLELSLAASSLSPAPRLNETRQDVPAPVSATPQAAPQPWPAPTLVATALLAVIGLSVPAWINLSRDQTAAAPAAQGSDASARVAAKVVDHAIARATFKAIVAAPTPKNQASVRNTTTGEGIDGVTNASAIQGPNPPPPGGSNALRREPKKLQFRY